MHVHYQTGGCIKLQKATSSMSINYISKFTHPMHLLEYQVAINFTNMLNIPKNVYLNNNTLN